MINDKECKFKCKYCNRKMHKFEYENYNGYCGKCRDIIEWKSILENIKEFKK